MAKNKNEISDHEIPKVLATTNVNDMICIDRSGHEYKIVGAKRRGKKVTLIIEKAKDEESDLFPPTHGW